jgi:hypothetical protein
MHCSEEACLVTRSNDQYKTLLHIPSIYCKTQWIKVPTFFVVSNV